MNHLIVFKLFLLYNFITKPKYTVISKFCQMADVGRFCKAVQAGPKLQVYRYTFFPYSKLTVFLDTIRVRLYIHTNSIFKNKLIIQRVT